MINRKPTQQPGRRSERGNVFFTLFGAVAIIGVLGAGIMATMRGPLSTMVEVNRRTQADTEMGIAMKLMLLEAVSAADNGDCDGDGFVEPMEMNMALPAPTNGGQVPASVGSSKIDPWGTPYGYCSWDSGPLRDDAACGGAAQDRLLGKAPPDDNDQDYPVIALISAGPNQNFETTCNDLGAGVTKAAGSDDVHATYTYATATAATGGLWSIKSGDPDTAVIGKEIEVAQEARFTGGINMAASTAALQLGAASMLYPTDIELPNCTTANNLLLRVNTATVPPTLEICHDDGTPTWESVAAGAAGVAIWKDDGPDGPNEIYYSAGNVGIGTNNPDDPLDVVGNVGLTGDIELATGTAVGWTGVGNITATTVLDISVNGGMNTAFDSTGIGINNSPIAGSMVYMTGNTAAEIFHIEDSSGGVGPILSVRDGGGVGIHTIAVDDALDVNGNIDASGSYELDNVNILTDNATAGTTLVGKGAGGVTTGANNTVVGDGAGAILTTGTDNIIIGQGANAPAATTNNYMNLGDAIHANLTTKQVGIGFADTYDVTGLVAMLDVNGDINATGDITSGAAIDADTTITAGTEIEAGGNITSTGGDVIANGTVYINDTEDLEPILCDDVTEKLEWDGGWDCIPIGGPGTGTGGMPTLEDVLTAGDDAGGESAYDLGGVSIGSNSLSAGSETLVLDVTGAAGADYFCDSLGNDCFVASDVGTLITGGIWENPGNVVRTVSTTVNYATDDFVFGSPALDSAGGQAARMFFDKSKAAFRAGNSSTQWDDANVGTDSVAFNTWTTASALSSTAFGNSTVASGDNSVVFGRNTIASGTGSMALGYRAQATGSRSVAMGLSDTVTGTFPVVSGTNSFGIFMGDQSGIDLTYSSTMGLYGGRMIINSNSPTNTEVAASTGGEEDLSLDVEGAIGADSYCDEFGNDCFEVADLSGFGIWQPDGTNNYIEYDDSLGGMRVAAVTGQPAPETDWYLDVAGATVYTPTNKVAIGSSTASTGGEQDLVLDVTGATGSTWYCDANGDNCFSAADVTGISINPADDREVLFNSNGELASNNNFVFTSAGRLGLGLTSPGGDLNVGDADASGNSQIYIGNTAVGSTYGNLYTSANTGGYFAIQSVQTQGTSWGDLILNPSGGNIGIADSTPNSGTGGQLMLDVEGNLGAGLYCDENGNNCFEANAVGVGIWEDAAGVIRPTSGTVNYATADFLFGSPTLALTTETSRMFFDKSKAAFRAGLAENTEWDDVNVGAHSAAWGRNTTASNVVATAWGFGSIASGDGATAWGGNMTFPWIGGTASGLSSTAWGEMTTANAETSTAWGYFSSAGGIASTAFGDTTIASGTNSTAWGANTTASGTNSTAFGGATTASGDFATAFGAGTLASGGGATVLGYKTFVGDGTPNGPGAFSVGIGFNDNTGASIANYPRVSGNGSMGLFMGDQANAIVSTNNVMALLGGTMIIDPSQNGVTGTTRTAPATGGVRPLELNVVGDVGAEYYCDVNGNNCFTAATAAGGAPGAPDRGVQFNSNGTFAANSTFVYTSAGRLGIGTASPTATMEVNQTFDVSVASGQGARSDVTSSGTGTSYNSIYSIFATTTANAVSSGGVEAYGVISNNYAAIDANPQSLFPYLASARTGPGDTSYGYYLADDNASTGGTQFGLYMNLNDTDVTRWGIYQLSANTNYFAGNIGVGDSTPNSGTGGQLALDVETNIGAALYCDQNGNNCFTPASVAAGGIFELSGTVVRPTSGVVNYTTDDFVFGSYQQDNTGNAIHGKRMYFDKSKGAFRAGDNAAGNSWDESLTGLASTAFGGSTVASGTNSMAWGAGNTASAQSSTAWGENSDATTARATAWGNDTTASGTNSTTWGSLTTASSDETTAFGIGSVATAPRAIAMGYYTTASGSASTAWGSQNTASGDHSTAFGAGTIASGAQSTAWGGVFGVAGVAASGITSTAFGREVVAGSGTAGDGAGDYSLAVGLQSGGQTTDPVVTGDRSAVFFFDGGVADANSAYNFSSSDKFAIIGGEFQIDDQSSTANKGCMRYNSSTTKLEFSHDCAAYTEMGAVASQIWEDASNLIRPTSGVVNYASADFLFGSYQLDDTGNAAHDARMFFDKDKAGFRAGRVTGTQWDTANLGNYSFAAGHNTTASGTYSTAFGNTSIASAQDSFAAGSNTTASGVQSTAFGLLTFAKGTASTSLGWNTYATGGNSFAVGKQVMAGSGTGGDGNGDGSMAFGLQTGTQTSFPQVLGDRSAVFFFDGGVNDANNNYDFTASDKFALIGGEFQIDDQSSTANKGCLRYNSGTTKLEFSHDCSTYAELGAATEIWSDSGAGYIEYSSALGGARIGAVTGANAPVYPNLNVTSNTSASAAGSDRQLQFNSSGDFAADTNLVYTSAGYLGIGTAAPDHQLQVYNASGWAIASIESGDRYSGAALQLMNDAQATGEYFGKIVFGYGDGSTDPTDARQMYLAGVRDRGLTFGTYSVWPSSTERMIIDMTGNVGIGDFGSDVVDSKLHIQSGDIRLDGGAANQAGCLRYDDTTDRMQFSHDCTSFTDMGASTAGGANTHVQFNSGGAFAGTSNFVWDESNTTLSVTGTVSASTKISLGAITGADAPEGLALDDLTDVNTTGLSSGEVLTYDGSSWVPQAAGVTGGIWEDASDVIRPTSGTVNYAAADFVFGSPGLEYDSNPDHAARMYFDKDKASFRVGFEDNGAWNYASSGYYSTAFGYNNQASGDNSMAWGNETAASNNSSTAWGMTTSASGDSSTAWGGGTTASGLGSTAWGQTTRASGVFSTAFGSNVFAGSGTAGDSAGDNSIAIGLQTEDHDTTPVVTGDRSMVLFFDNNIQDANSAYDFTASDKFAIIGGEFQIDDVSGSANKGCIRYNSATTKLEFSHDCSTYADMGATGSVTAAGSDTYIQYNSGNALGASGDFAWNNTTKTLNVNGTVSATDRIALGLTTGADAPNGLSLNGLSDVDTTGLSNGEVLTYNGSNWISQAVVGGTATPAGLNREIQFNDGGTVLGTDTAFTYTSGGRLTLSTGNDNVFVQGGVETTNGEDNTALGYNALVSMDAVCAGYPECTGNTAIGSNALGDATTGYQNTAIGDGALSNLTDGRWNVVIGQAAGNQLGTSSMKNVIIGNSAMEMNSFGNENTVLGYGAGAGVNGVTATGGNTFIGVESGAGITTGSNNVFLGNYSGYSVTSGAGNIMIGYGADAPLTTSSGALNIGGIIFGDRNSGSEKIGAHQYCDENLANCFEASSVAGGGGSAAGADRQIQFNSNGSFAADASMVFSSAGNFGIGTASPTAKMHIVDSGTINSATGRTGSQFTETLTNNLTTNVFPTGEALKGTLNSSGSMTTGFGTVSYSAIKGEVTATDAPARGSYSGLSGISTFTGTVNPGPVTNVGVLAQADGAPTVTTGTMQHFGLLATATGNLGTSNITRHYGASVTASGTAAENWGLNASVSGATTNMGVQAAATGAATTNIGIQASATGATNNYAAIFNSGLVGIGTTTPTYDVGIGGNAARTISMERHTTADTAGNNLTISAGGATVGAANKAGGTLILNGGISTGFGDSNVSINSYNNGSLANLATFYGGTYGIKLGGATTSNSNYSTAMGTATVASGSYSTAMGNQVTTGNGIPDDEGSSSFAVGLQTASQTTDPKITGDRSAVFFFDGGVANANSAYDFTASDKFAIIGGEFQIDNQSSTANKGCIRYNSGTTKLEYSHDCATYADMGASSGGAAGADREIQFNSGGSFSSASTFAYSSAGHLSIGTAPDADVLSIGGNSTGGALVSAQGAITPATSTDVLPGITLSPTFVGSSSHTGALVALDVYGIYSFSGPTTTVDNAYGLRVDGFKGGLSSTLTNYHGIYVKDILKLGTLTNAYGLYLQEMTGGTNNFTLYSSGGKNFFGGRVGIGTSTPTTALEVTSGAVDVARFNGTLAGNPAAVYINALSGQNAALTFEHGGADIFDIYGDSATGNLGFYSYGAGGIMLNLTADGAVMFPEITTPPAISASGEGKIYFDDTDDVFKISEDGGAWTDLLGSGGIWEDASGVIRPTSGTVNYTTADFVFGAPSLEYDSNPDHTARMYFDKDKGAFRAGFDDSGAWNYSSSGNYSVAFGSNTIASGEASLAMGVSTTASGDYSLAMGVSTTASAMASLAMGSGTTASSFASTALGINTGAFSAGTTAMGVNTIASGESSTAMGVNVTAGSGIGGDNAGDSSMAFGLQTQGQATQPVITGDRSAVFFFDGDVADANSAYDFTASDKLAIIGGELQIDNQSSTANKGCIRYNSGTTKLEYSHDCSTYDEMGDSGGAIWSDSGNGYIEYSSALGGMVVGAVTGADAPTFPGLNVTSGGGTPAGGANEIQFNSGSAFAASSGFTYNDTTKAIGLTGNQAAMTSMSVNNNTGSGEAGYGANVGSHVAVFSALGNANGGYGSQLADMTAFYSNSPVGMNFMVDSATGYMNFTVGGSSNERMRLTSSGSLVVGDTVQSVGEETLMLDVAGAIGGTTFCDEDGNDCFVAADVGAGSGIEVVTGEPAPTGFALDDIDDVDTTGVVDGECLVYENTSGNWETGACGGAGVALSDLANAAANKTLTNASYNQVWNWQLSGDEFGMIFGETAASTGGTAQGIVGVVNANGSTATPLVVVNDGVSNSFVVWDQAADTTSPFVIDPSGNIGVGIAAPTAKLDVRNSTIGNAGYMKMRLAAASTTDPYNLGITTNGDSIFEVTGEEGVTRQAMAFGDGSTSTMFGVGSSSDSGATWNPRFVVKTAGNVGIGTNAPSGSLHVVAPATTLASAAGAEFSTGIFTAPTITFTGTTNVTSQMDSFLFTPQTFAGTAATVDNAATMTIDGAPVKGGSVVLTNTHALKVNTRAVSTATNSYGLYVDAMTGATNNYAAVFNTGNVGIGTSSPTTEFMAVGTFGSGATLSTAGAGTRMFWYPRKGAFRAGTVAGTEWDNANIGNYSAAFGNESKATGSGAIAWGYRGDAAGDQSIAGGNIANAWALGSIALGRSVQVESGSNYSIALGNEATVNNSAVNSMAIGLGDPTGTIPRVSASNSLGIFLGDQSGVNVATANVMAIMGGNVGIGNVAPSVALDVTGDIEYSGTITDVSDIRLKDNITPLDARGSMLEKLGLIDTYSFTMKNDEKKQVEFGVMAQEIEKIFPELVRTANDKMGTKSVNYVGLIAPMIEAGKELEAQNKALKAEVAAIKASQEKADATLASLSDQVDLLNKAAGGKAQKAGMDIWSILGMLGLLTASSLFFLLGGILRTRKNTNG